MTFVESTGSFRAARENRRAMAGRMIPFGVPFLDDALLGIRPTDLVILGAPSGVGKTQICTTIAESVIGFGKRVHFFALEADEFEIQQRLAFSHTANLYFGDKGRKRLGRPFVYDEWQESLTDHEGFSELEDEAERYLETAYRNLHTFYKQGEFTVTHLVEKFTSLVGQTDLIILDHVHYFDWANQNDNEAMREIAKTARALVNEFHIPMILVAHLRKRDRNSHELVPGLDEFHGSSDLAKIATKAVTIAGGGPDAQGRGFVTFMRCPKNRHNGGVTRSVAKMIFNPRNGQYGREYELGPSNTKEFELYAPGHAPDWYGRTKRRNGGHGDSGVPGVP